MKSTCCPLAPGHPPGAFLLLKVQVMDKLEMVQVALRELGDVSSQELAGFIERRFKVKIEAKFTPCLPLRCGISCGWKLLAKRRGPLPRPMPVSHQITRAGWGSLPFAATTERK